MICARFRLLFATSGTRNAASTDIADYNAFVQTAAAGGHGAIRDHAAGFRVVASTAAVDARDNTGTTHTTEDTGLPIYWLGGNKAADDYEDFYDESWDDVANAKGRVRQRPLALRHCEPALDRQRPRRHGESTTSLGKLQVRIGEPRSSSSGDGPLSGNRVQLNTVTHPFYALSQVFVVGSEVTVPANWGLIPSGLGTGDKFRLLFVTYATQAATSADIADYNTYVQSQANANNAHADIRPYSAFFRVVGSTADVDARDNTGTTHTVDDAGVPIHWLNGAKAADDYEDFYDESWDDVASPRGRDGNAATTNVDRIWTGSKHDGTEKFEMGPRGRSARDPGLPSSAG